VIRQALTPGQADSLSYGYAGLSCDDRCDALPVQDEELDRSGVQVQRSGTLGETFSADFQGDTREI
jgi:hypothetical protein